MDKALKYRIVAWVVAIFFLILLPSAVSVPSQLQTTAIVSGIGIDKEGEEISLSAQILIPQPSTSYSPKSTVISGTGKDLMDAISAVELKTGQNLGLAHCYIIVLGDEICNDNLIETLDFLMRSNIMGNNTALIHTSKKAEDILKVSSQFSESDINNLQNIAKFNKENYNSASTSLIELFSEYALPASASVIGTIDSDESSNGQSSGSSEESSGSGGESSSQSGGSSSGSSTSAFKNEGKAIVIKNGKKILNLEQEDVMKFNWLDSETQKGNILIENYSDKDLQNATIGIRQMAKRICFNSKITNNTPILEANITLETRIESIENGGKIQSSHKNYYNDTLVSAIKTKVNQDIQDALSLAKEYNFDIMDIYAIFNSNKTADWKKYLSSLDNEDNYIQNLEIVVNVVVKNKE